MGACLCKGHKELHLPMTALQGQTEEGQPSSVKFDFEQCTMKVSDYPSFAKCSFSFHTDQGYDHNLTVKSMPAQLDSQTPSNGSVADKSSRYDIAELATSSLIGLVATIKEHITKPTAMAQGRVAHLIEWKGWGGGGEAARQGRGWSGAWSKGGGSWGGTELQEDEQFYSQMTDEIKEARFAAGVAEQFALAEAAMDVWSMNDGLEQPSTSLQAQSHFLSQFLLDGGSVGVPQHLYSIHAQTYGHSRASSWVAPPQADPTSPASAAQQGGDHPFEERGTVTSEAAVRHVDSSSLSEDDVFYN